MHTEYLNDLPEWEKVFPPFIEADNNGEERPTSDSCEAAQELYSKWSAILYMIKNAFDVHKADLMTIELEESLENGIVMTDEEIDKVLEMTEEETEKGIVMTEEEIDKVLDITGEGAAKGMGIIPKEKEMGMTVEELQKELGMTPKEREMGMTVEEIQKELGMTPKEREIGLTEEEIQKELRLTRRETEKIRWYYWRRVKMNVIINSYGVGHHLLEAEYGRDYYSKMEKAVFIREIVMTVVSVIGTMVVANEDLIDQTYAIVVIDEIEEFRKLFVHWVSTFVKEEEEEDEWGVFN